MHEFISQIQAMFQNNQVISTVAGGSLVVWAVSNLKNIWYNVRDAVVACISFRIVNTYEDSRGTGYDVTLAQTMFNKVLTESKSIWERTQNFDLSRGCCPEKADFRPYEVMLTHGFSIRRMLGKWVVCTRRIDRNQKITVTTELRVFFARKKKFMEKLYAAVMANKKAVQEDMEKRDCVCVYAGADFGGKKYKRAMDTIYTNNNEHIDLLESIKAFLGNQEKYRALSYPYSYSALLYGTPGCGKTSTILAIASALNRDIRYINPARVTVDQLLRNLNRDPDRFILVFEDIDAINMDLNGSREESVSYEDMGVDEYGDEEDWESGLHLSPEPIPSPVAIPDGMQIPQDRPAKRPDMGGSSVFKGASSLSDLLNITDGLLASDGTICLFTTNHIEKLDPALLRAGRMNKIVEFGLLNRQTAYRMIQTNLKGVDIAEQELKDRINPAELQEMIMNISLNRASMKDLRNKFCKDSKANV